MSYYGQGPPSGSSFQPPYGQQSGQYPPHPQGQHQPQQGYNQGTNMNQGYPQQGYPQQGYTQGGPGQHFNQPPPQPQGQAFPQGYAPPQGYDQNYGPPGQYGNYGPPQGQYGGYGAPPAAPPAPPSPGYIFGQRANMDMSVAANDLRRSMKGMGTDEKLLIGVLASLDPLQIQSVKEQFQTMHRRNLYEDVKKETSGHFESMCLALVRGPLDQDVHVIHEAVKGFGTKESALNDVLLARSNADLNAIKTRYQQLHSQTLESVIRGDLSGDTERLFDMVMSANRAEESSLVYPQQVEQDVDKLYAATEGRTGTDKMTVCSILTSRSNGQLRATSQAYQQKYKRTLDVTIQKEFFGHMQDALLFILRAAEDQAKHDADLLEASMRGVGTQDQALIRRVITIHWDKQRLQNAKAAYRHFYKQELSTRIQGETSRDYQKILLACIA